MKMEGFFIALLRHSSREFIINSRVLVKFLFMIMNTSSRDVRVVVYAAYDLTMSQTSQNVKVSSTSS